MNTRKLVHPCVAIALLFVILFSITPAFAHEITPLTASPAEGQVLAQSPNEVRLTFEEEVAEEGSSLQVFDNGGKQVDLGGGGVDLNDPQHAALLVGLPELAEGVYLVKWQVTLDDGDISQGEYYFGVGNVTLPAAAVDAPVNVEQPAQQPAPPSSSMTMFYVVLGITVVLAVVLIVVWLVRRPRAKT